jgi:hypothetical protein
MERLVHENPHFHEDARDWKESFSWRKGKKRLTSPDPRVYILFVDYGAVAETIFNRSNTNAIIPFIPYPPVSLKGEGKVGTTRSRGGGEEVHIVQVVFDSQGEEVFRLG